LASTPLHTMLRVVFNVTSSRVLQLTLHSAPATLGEP